MKKLYIFLSLAILLQSCYGLGSPSENNNAKQPWRFSRTTDSVTTVEKTSSSGEYTKEILTQPDQRRQQIEKLHSEETTRVVEWDTIVNGMSEKAWSAADYFKASATACRASVSWANCGNLAILVGASVIIAIVLAFKLIVGGGKFAMAHGSTLDVRRWFFKGDATNASRHSSTHNKRGNWVDLTVSSSTVSSSKEATSTKAWVCGADNVCELKPYLAVASNSASDQADILYSSVPKSHIQMDASAVVFFNRLFEEHSNESDKFDRVKVANAVRALKMEQRRVRATSSSSSSGDLEPKQVVSHQEASSVLGKLVSSLLPRLNDSISRPDKIHLGKQCPSLSVPIGRHMTYEEAAAIIKPLDYYCVRSDTLYSNVIQFVQNAARKCTFCTHGGFFIDTTIIRLKGMEDGELYVCESVISGDILPNGIDTIRDVTGAARNGVQIRKFREMMSAPEAAGCIFMVAPLNDEVRERVNNVIGPNRQDKKSPCQLRSALLSYLGKPYPTNPFNFMPGIDKYGITSKFADEMDHSYFCSELVTAVYARTGVLPSKMLAHARRVYPVDFLIDGVITPSKIFKSVHVIQSNGS